MIGLLLYSLWPGDEVLGQVMGVPWSPRVRGIQPKPRGLKVGESMSLKANQIAVGIF